MASHCLRINCEFPILPHKVFHELGPLCQTGFVFYHLFLLTSSTELILPLHCLVAVLRCSTPPQYPSHVHAPAVG